MTSKNAKEIDFSLSDEEKNDVDQMIKDFNRERNTLQESPDHEDQLKFMKDRFELLGDVILKINDRVDSLYEILRLMQKKSEILNTRFYEIRESL